MENTMKKNELIVQLRTKNIDFPTNATVAELRKIFAEKIGKNGDGDNSERSETRSDPNSVGDKNIQHNDSEKSNNNVNSIESENNRSADTHSDARENEQVTTGSDVDTNKNTQPTIQNKNDNASSSNDDDNGEQEKLDKLLLRIPKTQNQIELMELEKEEELIDARLRVLKKRQQLLDLENQQTLAPHITQHIFRPKYQEIKHLVPLYSSSEDYDAHKWIADFERACDSVNADMLTRLKFFRQSMKSESEAELFLRTDNSHNYSEIRKNFLENFGHSYSVSEIIDKLRKTTFRSAKTSVMGYILKMQEIASRASIDELQTVQFIIEGFEDKTPHIAILYPAGTIARLKQLAHRYSQMRETNSSNTSTIQGKFRQTTINNNSATPSGSDSVPSTSKQAVQCYNCSGFGHFAGQCTAPKRESGSCFRCGSKQHQLKDCPKPKPPPSANRVALIDRNIEQNSGDELSKNIQEINMVSVTFLTNCSVQSIVSKNFISLFDTGSPISLMKHSAVPEQLTQQRSMKYSGYDGLGHFKLCTYGKIKIQIEFRNIVKNINIFVIPDNLMSHSVLLGRDFMRAFNIQLSIVEPILNKISKPKVEINLERNKIRVSNKSLHCVYSSDGVSKSRALLDCELCRLLPDVCIANCEKLECKYSDLSDDNVDHILAIDITKDNSETFDINPFLNIFHREAIQKIIKNDYLDLDNIQPIEHNYKLQIRLTSDVPISFRPRRLSYSDKLIVNETIDELLKKGIIRPSNSPYAFPIVLPPKKDGTKRMCVDYKPLNKIMIRDSFPLPLIDDCLERMEGNRYFTTLDLKNGFHQINMSEESIQYTAFVVPMGQYEYTKMPFGLKVGPGVFQRFMNWVLEEFIREGSVITYMDDITLVSKTIPEHLLLLKRVLRRLAEFRLEIKPSKCKFCYSEIDILGFTVNSQGIRPNDRHLEAVKNMLPPKNVDQVHKILG